MVAEQLWCLLLKKYAKAMPGSVYVKDQRTGDRPA
jgi:hypothetical protein